MMTHPTNLIPTSDLFDDCYNKGLGWVSFRLPRDHESTNEIRHMIDPQAYRNRVWERQDRNGFVVAPFDLQKNPALWMEASFAWTGDSVALNQLQNESWFREPLVHAETKPSPRQHDQSQKEFCEKVREIIEILQKNKSAHPSLQKVVWSRTLTTPLPVGLKPFEYFKKICETYPEVHAVLCYHPSLGLWIGASPEILIQKNEGMVLSMALAGTRPAPNSGETARPWRPKEILEQGLVVDYLQKRFSGMGLFPQTGPTGNFRAGSIEHLHTVVSAQTTDDSYPLALELHPSPAIAGEPKEQALQLIVDQEPHDRGLYGGFWGFLDQEGCGRLSVNLRCLRWYPGKAVLYAGAGILADSDADAEWQETCRKSETLLKLLIPPIPTA